MNNQRIVKQQTNIDGTTVTVMLGLNGGDLEVAIAPSVEMYPEYNEGAINFVVKAEGDTELFFGSNDQGIVEFFSYSGEGRGYGGNKFYLEMADGTERCLKGPWSSRSGVMNRAGFEPCSEITLQTKYHYASAMTIEVLNKHLKPLGYKMCPYTKWEGEVYYKPVPIHYVALWADGTWAEIDELDDYTWMSDDYQFIDSDTVPDYA